MLYLMLDMHNGTKLAKVGVTRRALRQRRSQYKTHNPLAIMRSSCAGTEGQEGRCQTVLFSKGTRIRGTEWAIVSDELFSELYEKGMGYFYPNHSPIHFHERFAE